MYDDYDNDYLDGLDDELDSYNDEIDDYNDNYNDILRAKIEERNAYDDFIASLDMDN